MSHHAKGQLKHTQAGQAHSSPKKAGRAAQAHATRALSRARHSFDRSERKVARLRLKLDRAEAHMASFAAKIGAVQTIIAGAVATPLTDAASTPQVPTALDALASPHEDVAGVNVEPAEATPSMVAGPAPVLESPTAHRSGAKVRHVPSKGESTASLPAVSHDVEEATDHLAQVSAVVTDTDSPGIVVDGDKPVRGKTRTSPTEPQE